LDFKQFLVGKYYSRRSGMIAMENLKNRSVDESIPFCVNVLTKTPPDPNISPARIGKIRYIFFI